MKKNKKRIYVFESGHLYDDDWTIEEFEGLIYNAKQAGATHIKIETDSEYDSSWAELKMYYNRDETDEEYSERRKKESERAASERKWKVDQLEKLKKELGVK